MLVPDHSSDCRRSLFKILDTVASFNIPSPNPRHFFYQLVWHRTTTSSIPIADHSKPSYIRSDYVTSAPFPFPFPFLTLFLNHKPKPTNQPQFPIPHTPIPTRFHRIRTDTLPVLVDLLTALPSCVTVSLRILPGARTGIHRPCPLPKPMHDKLFSLLC